MFLLQGVVGIPVVHFQLCLSEVVYSKWSGEPFWSPDFSSRANPHSEEDPLKAALKTIKAVFSWAAFRTLMAVFHRLFQRQAYGCFNAELFLRLFLRGSYPVY